MLEVASGTGQHISYFAPHFPNFTFYPTENDASLLPSIKAYADETPTKNVRDPIQVDVKQDYQYWGLDFKECDYLININMIHITPPVCTTKLFEAATMLLKLSGIMITYGPYADNGVITPQSNVEFNESLKARDPSWGLRDLRDLGIIAKNYKMNLIKVYDMPANNKCVIWQKDNF